MSKYSFFTLILTASVLYEAALSAVPAQVLIIRHGEKPHAGVHLNTKGRERAAALVPHFLETPELTAFGPPVAIYAQNQPTKTHSARPIETVTPLAHALKLPVITRYAKNEYHEMANEILTHPVYEGKAVLISWGHTVIAEIAQALGASTAPGGWPETYDRIWIITYLEEGGVEFTDLPQKLLHGDSKR